MSLFSLLSISPQFAYQCSHNTFFAEDTDEDEEGVGEEDADSNTTSDMERNSEPDSVDDEEGMGSNYSGLVSVLFTFRSINFMPCPQKYCFCHLQSIFGHVWKKHVKLC